MEEFNKENAVEQPFSTKCGGTIPPKRSAEYLEQLADLEEDIKIRTRFAPSPTGYMHIGNLRTALYEYLIAKNAGGTFVLRIEDTDQNRFVEGSMDVIFDTLKMTGLHFDEGPGVGGDFGPYVQSEREYLTFAEELVEKNKAYYCFCQKDDKSDKDEEFAKRERCCAGLAAADVAAKLAAGEPFVIRQLIPEGKTTFFDKVFGEITVSHDEIEDQILIKSDGMPTYNFANVVDDHAMQITHVVRGSEYLTSTPKYNLLYKAFGWEIPTYVHLPLMLNEAGEKLSKRHGSASFQDLLAEGFLPAAIINYIAFLGWSSPDNREFFNLQDLTEAFTIDNISKAPSKFDREKLLWMNGEHIKQLPPEEFFPMAEPILRENIKSDVDLSKISQMVQTRIHVVADIAGLVDFVDNLPDYDIALFTHKKMKTDAAIAKTGLELILPILEGLTAENWDNATLYAAAVECAQANGLKNSQVLWPIRTALSGRATSFCGASELCELFGRDESLRRLRVGVEKLAV
ncbi:MAG: glutamate--tRNA ligase [Turicibacter sp.]|nr:glutamate--tRNA ligase [Turicibacter sp.]